MNRKQQKTLRAIFSVPTAALIKFADIEKLMLALGAEINEGNGSRLSFELNEQKLASSAPGERSEEISG